MPRALLTWIKLKKIIIIIIKPSLMKTPTSSSGCKHDLVNSMLGFTQFTLLLVR